MLPELEVRRQMQPTSPQPSDFTYTEREQAQRMRQTRSALRDFQQAASKFKTEAGYAAYNLPANTLKAGGTSFKYVGMFNDLLYEVFFKPVPKKFDIDSPGLPVNARTNRLTNMPMGILPALVLFAKVDEKVAVFFENVARRVLFQSSHEIKHQNGESRVVIDIFGYGKIATASKQLARKMRTERPGFMNTCWDSLIDVVEKFALLMDSLCKLLYIPFATWRATAAAKNQVVSILYDLIAPVGEIVYGLSVINHGIESGLIAAGDSITWKRDFAEVDESTCGLELELRGGHTSPELQVLA